MDSGDIEDTSLSAFLASVANQSRLDGDLKQGYSKVIFTEQAAPLIRGIIERADLESISEPSRKKYLSFLKLFALGRGRKDYQNVFSGSENLRKQVKNMAAEARVPAVKTIIFDILGALTSVGLSGDGELSSKMVSKQSLKDMVNNRKNDQKNRDKQENDPNQSIIGENDQFIPGLERGKIDENLDPKNEGILEATDFRKGNNLNQENEGQQYISEEKELEDSRVSNYSGNLIKDMKKNLNTTEGEEEEYTEEEEKTFGTTNTNGTEEDEGDQIVDDSSSVNTDQLSLTGTMEHTRKQESSETQRLSDQQKKTRDLYGTSITGTSHFQKTSEATGESGEGGGKGTDQGTGEDKGTDGDFSDGEEEGEDYLEEGEEEYYDEEEEEGEEEGREPRDGTGNGTNEDDEEF